MTIPLEPLPLCTGAGRNCRAPTADDVELHSPQLAMSEVANSRIAASNATGSHLAVINDSDELQIPSPSLQQLDAPLAAVGEGFNAEALDLSRRLLSRHRAAAMTALARQNSSNMMYVEDDEDVPVMVVDLGEVRRKFAQWKECLPTVMPFYAVKANNDKRIVETLFDLGCGFDCASRVEIDSLLGIGRETVRGVLGHEEAGGEEHAGDASGKGSISKSGVAASNNRVIFSHPRKLPSDFKQALRKGVFFSVFDSDEELVKMARICDQVREEETLKGGDDLDVKNRVRLLLRIGCFEGDAASDKGKLRDKFGLQTDGGSLAAASRKVFTLAKQLGFGSSVVGVSFHIGWGHPNPNSFCHTIANARAVFDVGRGPEMFGPAFRVLNIGGGQPGEPSECSYSFVEFSTAIRQALDEHFPGHDRWLSANSSSGPVADIDNFFSEIQSPADPAQAGFRIMAEPGTFLALSSGTYVTRIGSKSVARDVEGRRHVRWYLNDGVHGSFAFCSRGIHGVPFALKPPGDPQVAGREVQAYAANLRSQSRVMRPGMGDEAPIGGGLESGNTSTSTFFGPTCDGTDRLNVLFTKHLPEGDLDTGDYLIWPNFGVYSTVVSSSFNGYGRCRTFYLPTHGADSGLVDKPRELK